MKIQNVDLPDALLADFCRRWKVASLAVFGSALTDRFGPESDLDLLVGFRPDAEWSLIDHLRMEEELASLSGREVDLVSREAVERSPNRPRRESILGGAREIYVSR